MTPLLDVRDLHTQFRTRAGTIRAVDGVSFTVMPGGALGIVGESGSGKSVTSLSIMRLVDPPGIIAGGEILFHGRDLVQLPERDVPRASRPRHLPGIPRPDDRPKSGLHRRRPGN